MKIKVPFKVSEGENFVYIKPWNTEMEKEFLMSVSEVDDIGSKIRLASKILIPKFYKKHKDLSPLDLLYVLLVISCEISQSTKTVLFTCKNCKQVSEATFNIRDAIKYIPSEKYVHNSITLYGGKGINFLQCLNKSPENIVLKDYIFLEKKHKELEGSLELLTQSTCLVCNTTINIHRTLEDIFENYITELSLHEYYNMFLQFKQNGISLTEYNSFMPFEREIIKFSIINKNKKNKDA